MGDEWSGFADLLANLIEKYADELDIDNLPEPPKIKKSKEFSTLKQESVENQKAALYNCIVIIKSKHLTKKCAAL